MEENTLIPCALPAGPLFLFFIFLFPSYSLKIPLGSAFFFLQEKKLSKSQGLICLSSITAACYPLTSTHSGEPLPDISPPFRHTTVSSSRHASPFSQMSFSVNININSTRRRRKEEKKKKKTDGNGYQDFTSILTTSRSSSDGANDEVLSHNRTRNHASDFEPCSKLEDLNLDVRKTSKDTTKQYATKKFSRRRHT